MGERKTCLLAGGSAGLIKGIAAAGYDLAVQPGSGCVRAICAAAKEAAASGAVRVEVLEAELCEPGGTAKGFERFDALFGRLDLYVKTCGPGTERPFLDMEETEFHRTNNEGWRSAYFGVCEAGKRFARQGKGGCIVLVGSNRFRLTRSGESLQGSIGAALSKLAQYAALEYAKYGARAVCLAPGSPAKGGVPLGEPVSDSELAEWIRFVASPAAASLTGATIELDGGECLVDQPMEYYGL